MMQCVRHVRTMHSLVVHSTQNQPQVDCPRAPDWRVMETRLMNGRIAPRLHVRHGRFHFQLHNFPIAQQEQRQELPEHHSMTN